MEYYAGIDVSLESSSICVVDGSGRIIREAKVSSEPDTLLTWFKGLGLGFGLARIGLEAGPLSQWLSRHAGGRSHGGTAGDATRAQRIQGNAGED
jgi:transposase